MSCQESVRWDFEYPLTSMAIVKYDHAFSLQNYTWQSSYVRILTDQGTYSITLCWTTRWRHSISIALDGLRLALKINATPHYSLKNKWLFYEITNKERLPVAWGKFSNDNITSRFQKCWMSSNLGGYADDVLWKAGLKTKALMHKAPWKSLIKSIALGVGKGPMSALLTWCDF